MKPKVTQITHVHYHTSFKQAKHTEERLWDSNDTEIAIWLIFLVGTVSYFIYGLLI